MLRSMLIENFENYVLHKALISKLFDNFFQKTNPFLMSMKMHDKFFYQPNTGPLWAEERPFDEVPVQPTIETFQKFENSKGRALFIE